MLTLAKSTIQQIPIIYWNHNSVKLVSTILTKLNNLCKIECSHSKFQYKPFALLMLEKREATAESIYIVLPPLTLRLLSSFENHFTKVFF